MSGFFYYNGVMKIKQIVLVSGLSGAGKSSAMSVLEDSGYLCIDNFPLGMLESLLQWIAENDDVRYYYLALSTTASDFSAAYKIIKNQGINVDTVFLMASNDELIQRYQFTRNRHPFIISNEVETLQQAINKERQQIMGLPDDILKIDTTELTQKGLREIIEARFSKEGNHHFSVSFISFGFRYGLPLDADVVFDARFLANPHWVEELRPLTGNDKTVQDYVFADKRSKELIKEITSYLDLSLREFNKEKKSHMSVAIGCTGGKHRSVTLVNHLAEHYRDKFHVLKFHRDINR